MPYIMWQYSNSGFKYGIKSKSHETVYISIYNNDV